MMILEIHWRGRGTRCAYWATWRGIPRYVSIVMHWRCPCPWRRLRTPDHGLSHPIVIDWRHGSGRQLLLIDVLPAGTRGTLHVRHAWSTVPLIGMMRLRLRRVVVVRLLLCVLLMTRLLSVVICRRLCVSRL